MKDLWKPVNGGPTSAVYMEVESLPGKHISAVQGKKVVLIGICRNKIVHLTMMKKELRGEDLVPLQCSAPCEDIGELYIEDIGLMLEQAAAKLYGIEV